jgi:hypothetical protein
MKHSHDFSQGKRGRIVRPAPEPLGKTRITIRLVVALSIIFSKRLARRAGKPGIKRSSTKPCDSTSRAKRQSLKRPSAAYRAKKSAPQADGNPRLLPSNRYADKPASSVAIPDVDVIAIGDQFRWLTHIELNRNLAPPNSPFRPWLKALRRFEFSLPHPQEHSAKFIFGGSRRNIPNDSNIANGMSPPASQFRHSHRMTIGRDAICAARAPRIRWLKVEFGGPLSILIEYDRRPAGSRLRVCLASLESRKG